MGSRLPRSCRLSSREDVSSVLRFSTRVFLPVLRHESFVAVLRRLFTVNANEERTRKTGRKTRVGKRRTDNGAVELSCVAPE